MTASTDAPDTGDAQPIIVVTSAGVAVIRLNRPDRLNAINAELATMLIDELGRAAADRAVRAAVLTGAGRAFCAGGDLANLTRVDERPIDQALAESRRLMSAAEALHRFPKPLIAAVNGACAGAGLSFACAADLRVAARSAVFAAAFLRAGRSGDYGLAWTLPRLIGAGRARRLLLLGERIPADDALAIGLVDEIADDDAVLATATGIASQLADLSPTAVQNLKRNLLAADETGLAAYLDGESDRHILTARGPEAVEAATALVEKRRPSFSLSDQ